MSRYLFSIPYSLSFFPSSHLSPPSSYPLYFLIIFIPSFLYLFSSWFFILSLTLLRLLHYSSFLPLSPRLFISLFFSPYPPHPAPFFSLCPIFFLLFSLSHSPFHSPPLLSSFSSPFPSPRSFPFSLYPFSLIPLFTFLPSFSSLPSVSLLSLQSSLSFPFPSFPSPLFL